MTGLLRHWIWVISPFKVQSTSPSQRNPVLRCILVMAVWTPWLFACAASTQNQHRTPPPQNPGALAVMVESSYAPFYTGRKMFLSDEMVKFQESTREFNLVAAEQAQVRKQLISEIRALGIFENVFDSDLYALGMYKPALMLNMTTLWYVRGMTREPQPAPEERPLSDEGMLYEVTLIERQSGGTVYAHTAYCSARRQPALVFDEPLLTERDKAALREWFERASQVRNMSR